MERAAAHYRRDLKKLTQSITAFLGRLDDLMKEPSTDERGRRIAKLCNAMEMVNDQVRYGSLGINFRTDKKPERQYRRSATLLNLAE